MIFTWDVSVTKRDLPQPDDGDAVHYGGACAPSGPSPEVDVPCAGCSSVGRPLVGTP